MMGDRAVSGPLGVLFEAGPAATLDDGELLGRFLDAEGVAAEAAVAALVDRHAAMVWRTCHAATGHDADAADAFQATFLVLIRRARSIRSRPSVAGWLGGVARRVAARARADDSRRRRREGAAAARGGEPIGVDPDPGSSELAAIVRAELARLSERDRDVILACDLDGLTETEAARRLDCPVGTVRSRLHRARGRLRARLAARGLDPASTLGALPALAPGRPPAGLAARAAALALAAGGRAGVGAGAVPAGVALLASQAPRSALMLPLCSTATILLALAGLVPDVVPTPDRAPLPSIDQLPARPAEPPPPGTNAARAARPKPSAAELADRFRAIRAEYDRIKANADEKKEAFRTEAEQAAVLLRLRPDEAEFARRMLDLAFLDPPSRTARDAAIWVMDKTWMSDNGPFGGAFETAAGLLISHHADDPEAVRVGLHLDRMANHRRDAFLEGCYANATSHESKGLARLAYAQYLENKVPWVRSAHKSVERSTIRGEARGPDGKNVPMTMPEPNADFAYKVGLRWIDPDAMRAEAERLYREVIAEYADVPYVSLAHRRLEDILDGAVTRGDNPMTEGERQQIRANLATRITLADVARERLRGMIELQPGQPAPPIRDVDILTGRPFQLADLRGKVVLLLPWTYPQGSRRLFDLVKERERRERERGRPFVVLGVAVSFDRETARRAIEREGLAWTNAFERIGPEDGQIIRDYQFHDVLRAVLIDAEGKIINPNVQNVDFDAAVDRALDRRDAAEAP